MSSTERLPLLPLDDAVVLPGMAVPVELSDAEARVAVDAAGVDEGTMRLLVAATARPLRPRRDRCRRPAGRPAARRSAGRPGPRRGPRPDRRRDHRPWR